MKGVHYITYMKKRVVLPLIFLLVVFAFFILYGDVSENKVSPPQRALASEEDSERLLYDDAFMDEMIKNYTLRSLTQSLSRLGYVKGIDCHNRAHEMGRRAYELLGAEAFKNCGIECHSGCRHGATEAFFAENGTSDLISGMHTICGEEQGNKFHMHQCVHGVGHGLMAWYDYELHDALAACDLIVHPFHQESCYSGVFMENIVGSITVDTKNENTSYHYTEYLSEDPHYPCNAVEEKYRFQCYWGQTDRMLQLFGTIEPLGGLCGEVTGRPRYACFRSMGRTSSHFLAWRPPEVFSVCNVLSEDADKNACLSGALSDLFWDETQMDRAIELCRLVHSSSFEKMCYDEMIIRASEVLPLGSREDFCEKLPPEYQNHCVQQQTPQAFPLSASDGGFSRVLPEKTEEAVIRYTGTAYVPDVMHVSVGQGVTWVNSSDELFWPASNLHPTHTAYPGSGIKKCDTPERGGIFDACESLESGSEYSFVFTEEGQWRYHDHINPQATGTIIVSE